MEVIRDDLLEYTALDADKTGRSWRTWQERQGLGLRIVLIVIDSGGIGEAPDSAVFNDGGANTIQHTLDANQDIRLPHLNALGLSRLLKNSAVDTLTGVGYPVYPKAQGKDTLTGHWEMMGLVVQEPFRTYPEGFPPDIVDQLEHTFGRKLIGNEAASGTEIMDRLGEQHIATGSPIVYTSADSVLQIAAHEQVVPISQLYDWCQQARHIMQGPHLVGRVIARPFLGEPGHFYRTPNRHDYGVAPSGVTQLDMLQEAQIPTIGIGKIGDIFSGQGLQTVIRTTSNQDGLDKTREVLETVQQSAFIFTNLVEFDSHYGHRRDVRGYGRALRELDRYLPVLFGALHADDQLWITADHGCDPTFRGTDHTRETLPWLSGGSRLRPYIGDARLTLADIGATLSQIFQVKQVGPGQVAQQLVP